MVITRKLKSERNKTNCLDDLKRRILTEALEPGVYLDEMELAEEYRISRPPPRKGRDSCQVKAMSCSMKTGVLKWLP